MAIQGSRGQVMLEFILSLPLLMFLAGGVIDLGLALRENSVIAEAARLLGRRAAQYPALINVPLAASRPETLAEFCATENQILSSVGHVSGVGVSGFTLSVRNETRVAGDPNYDLAKVTISRPSRAFGFIGDLIIRGNYTTTFALETPRSNGGAVAPEVLCP